MTFDELLAESEARRADSRRFEPELEGPTWRMPGRRVRLEPWCFCWMCTGGTHSGHQRSSAAPIASRETLAGV